MGKHYDAIWRHTQGVIPDMAADTATDPASLVAHRVRDLRTELGMNQTEFARALSASRSYVSDVENGNAKVSVDLLFTIVERFARKTKKAALVWLLTGRLDPVPWGDAPHASPLNVVLGLDGRALVGALKAVDTLERAEKQSLQPEVKAPLLRNALYIYMSEMLRAIQGGTGIEEARRMADAACENMVKDFDITVDRQGTR